MNNNNINKISIKAARVNANLTQEELAKKLGVHRQTIAKWENCPSSMKISKVTMLCDALKISISNIF